MSIPRHTPFPQTTCRRDRPGSWNHYEQDAKTVTGWGVDFVKVDNCGHPPNAPSIQVGPSVVFPMLGAKRAASVWSSRSFVPLGHPWWCVCGVFVVCFVAFGVSPRVANDV